MKEIQLTHGKVALVDDEDYEKLSQFKWCALSNGCTFYAVHSKRINSKKWVAVLMHREIMGARSGVEVDHIDGNGCNNQKHNLRLASHSENARNRRKQRNNVSGFVGVSWDGLCSKWRATICIDGRSSNLGIFETKCDAAQAYNDAAVKYFGEFARLNLIGKAGGSQ